MKDFVFVRTSLGWSYFFHITIAVEYSENRNSSDFVPRKNTSKSKHGIQTDYAPLMEDMYTPINPVGEISFDYDRIDCDHDYRLIGIWRETGKEKWNYLCIGHHYNAGERITAEHFDEVFSKIRSLIHGSELSLLDNGQLYDYYCWNPLRKEIRQNNNGEKPFGFKFINLGDKK